MPGVAEYGAGNAGYQPISGDDDEDPKAKSAESEMEESSDEWPVFSPDVWDVLRPIPFSATCRRLVVPLGNTGLAGALATLAPCFRLHRFTADRTLQ